MVKVVELMAYVGVAALLAFGLGYSLAVVWRERRDRRRFDALWAEMLPHLEDWEQKEDDR